MQSILNHNQTIQSGYTGGRMSPVAIVATVAVHLAIGGLVWMLPPGTIEKLKPDIIWITNIPAEKQPEVLQQDTKEQPLQRHTEAKQETIVDTKTLSDDDSRNTEQVLSNGNGGGMDSTLDTKTVTHEPILVGAVPDPKRLTDFQPSYPSAMIRAQMEGFATVRVHINEAGRVETVELIDTNDSAFWKATREQALKRWRFRPATRDGVAIPSDRVMTVRFRLSDIM